MNGRKWRNFHVEQHGVKRLVPALLVALLVVLFVMVWLVSAGLLVGQLSGRGGP